MKAENNIDRYFRKNLYDFQASPPEGVWDSIEQDLKKSSRRFIIPMYIKVAAGIILLVSLAAILWRITDNTKSIPSTVLSEEINPTEKVIENTVAEEITGNQESIGQLTKSESTDPPTESSSAPVVAQSATTSDEPGMILPTDIQEEQNDIQSEIIPNDSETYIAASEIVDEPDTEKEISGMQQEESKEKINKNDLIIQQNLMVAEESSDESSLKSTSKWSIGGQAGPQYSYRDVSVNPDYQNAQNYDQFEDGMLAFAGGINVQVKAAKRFSIQSGVYYSKIGQEVSSIVYGNADVVPTDVVADEPNTNPSIGSMSKNNQPTAEIAYAENLSITQGSFITEQQFEFVEIPLVFKYFVVDRKLGVSVNGGLWTNILVGNKAVTTGSDNYRSEEETNEINTVNYSGSLGFGFNYPITSNLRISLDPIFKYYLSPINSNPETEVHPYTFGIMTGINFTF